MAQYWTSLIWQKASPIILSDNDTFDPLRDWALSEVGTLCQQDESLLWVSSESEPQLPLQIEDASRKETEEDETDGLTITVKQDTRLDKFR